MHALISNTIHLCFLVGVGLGQVFFSRNWYKAYLILLYARDITQEMFGTRRRFSAID